MNLILKASWSFPLASMGINLNKLWYICKPIILQRGSIRPIGPASATRHMVSLMSPLALVTSDCVALSNSRTQNLQLSVDIHSKS